MWTLGNLIDTATHAAVEIDGRWMPVRPLTGPFVWRLCDAWEVLRGRADAVRWPGGQ